MKNIIVIGAGLSSSYLIKYLLDNASSHQWHITVADTDILLAQSKVKNHSNGTAAALNVNDLAKRQELIRKNDLVISMLPAAIHLLVAKDCLGFKKHLITASYISTEMQQLHKEALKNNLLFLNECGLDPGIDHLSAMKMIHEIQKKDGEVTSFKSFCGGLVAPEYDDNPWNYKFTWNPRNVIIAGQATARYLENGELKFIPPSRIFTQTEEVKIEGYGEFENYANRDSLSYIKPYGIESAKTVLRGTLRRKGFSANWNYLVRLGLTDDSFVIPDSDKISVRAFVSAFTPGKHLSELEKRVCDFLDTKMNSDEFKKLEWLGLFSDEKIKLREATPAQILQNILQEKWKLKKGELDMIVMKHIIKYEVGSTKCEVGCSLVVKGEDEVLTAMAKTVGLPMAIAAKLLLTDKIKGRGVLMPITPEFYEPILAELETFGVKFIEVSC
ncbi:MAG: saccharopine dehydrogenase C-terminal domain-containing protein [Bacteroidia bacterium]